MGLMLQPNSVKEVAEKLVLQQAEVADFNLNLEFMVVTTAQAAKIAYEHHLRRLVDSERLARQAKHFMR